MATMRASNEPLSPISHPQQSKMRDPEESKGIRAKVNAAASIWASVKDVLFTFTCQREIRVRDVGLAGTNRILQVAILIYVIITMVNAYTYLTFENPTGTNTAWERSGTFYNNNLLTSPQYCQPPFTNDFYESNDFVYTNITCTIMPREEVCIKNSPTFFFFTTFVQQKTLTTRLCSENVADCNPSSSNVRQYQDACTCTAYNNFYTVNPEGLQLEFEQSMHSIDPASEFASEHELKANGRGKNSMLEGDRDGLKIMTVVREDRQGSNIFKFDDPNANVILTVQDMLSVAGVSLNDQVANEDLVAETLQAMQTHSSGAPYNRLTGVELTLDLEYTNFDVDDTWADKDDARLMDLVCIITISRSGIWSSMGHDISDMETPVYKLSNGNNGNYTNVKTGKVVDNYRFGVKTVFKSHGKLGFFSFSSMVNGIVQGLVLLGLATTICRNVAIYLYPLLGSTGYESLEKCSHIGNIFTSYQSAFIDWRRVFAKSAMHAAVNAANFLSAFDHKFVGKASKRLIYQHLRMSLQYDLTDAQIAEVVEEVMQTADIDGNGYIAIDEFCHFMAPDECNLFHLVDKYEANEGDEKILEHVSTIDESSANAEYLHKLHRVNDSVAEMNHSDQRSAVISKYAYMSAQRYGTSYGHKRPPPPPPPARPWSGPASAGTAVPMTTYPGVPPPPQQGRAVPPPPPGAPAAPAAPAVVQVVPPPPAVPQPPPPPQM